MAVAALSAAGFAHSDLSVLASHESIDAAGAPGSPWRDAAVAIFGEWKVEVPLVASGAILLAGGPAAATIAAVVGATVGGLAVKEVVDEVTDRPHTESFALAVEEGRIVLWVRAEDGTREAAARRILEDNGGTDVHAVARPPVQS